jgi:cytochrome c5
MAEEIHSHETPIKTPRQLLTVVVLAFVVPIIIIVLLVYLVTSGPKPDKNSPAMSPESVAARIRPVASVNVGEGGGATGAALQTAEEVYKSSCMACHDTGAAGAPKKGDAGQWAPRIKQGQNVLVANAIKGKGAMPPKGGATQLSDTEIARAVVYLANASGAKFKESAAPAAPAAASSPAASSAGAPAAATAAPAASASTPAAGKPDGKKVYEATCFACHNTGVANAPKLGDKAAWAPHLAHGANELYETALKGKGAMPPKGGNAALSEADVKAAVDYMVSAVKK